MKLWIPYLIYAYLFIFVFLYSHYSKAMTFENSIGGLTYHLQNPGDMASLYSNKISDDGRLIFTGLLGLAFTDGHDNLNLFVTQNSIGNLSLGWTYSYMWKWKSIEYGPIVGLYLQDDTAFLARGIQPYSIGFGIVPIVGGQISLKVLTFDNRFVKLNTIITPVIVNETLSIGVEL